MKAYLGQGDKVEVVAPGGGVTAGLGYVIGNGLFVVAEGTAAATVNFVGLKKGRVRLPKNTSDALTQGNKVYWDNTAKEVRAASATGRFLIGTATKTQLAAETTADVELDGISVTAVP